MIGRDEGHCVGRALASVSALADEIVFVDTGSVDNTREIAAVFGARVFSYKWSDDFSAARNEGLEKCRGRWILVLDCDEVIYPPLTR